MVSGEKVQIYKNRVICFVQESTPKAILFKDLSNCSEQPLLLALCKDLLADGRADLFEYCAPYLQCYDPVAITPYIERYKNADFTEREVEVLSEAKIKEQYISFVATNLQ